MKSLSQMQQNNFDEQAIKELLGKIGLMGNSDVAKLLNWSMSKVTTYTNRGVLPEPLAFIGGRPIWARIQIEEFVKKGRLK